MAGTTNGQYWSTRARPILGMIDANAYHGSLNTWPLPLLYAQFGGDGGEKKEVIKKIMATILPDGIKLQEFQIAEMGGLLTKLNTYMYKNNNHDTAYDEYKKRSKDLSDIKKEKDRLQRSMDGKKKIPDELEGEDKAKWNELDKKEQGIKKKMSSDAIPSLIIVQTMDMEFAHIDGYKGKPVYHQNSSKEIVYKKRTIINGQMVQSDVVLTSDEKLLFQNWDRQIEDTEVAVIKNPLRLFPLFSYDPRRYRCPIGYNSNQRYEQPLPEFVGGEGCGPWIEPFEYIVGHDRASSEIKKVWIGFEMNPLLGFRPFDEFCDYLPEFYKECVDKKIPIRAHCAVDGVITYDAKFYKSFDNDKFVERIYKSRKRHQQMELPKTQNALCSHVCRGLESVDKDPDLDYFYMNYGHPRNWIPVLEHYPDLHLCLGGFGGNSEWSHNTMVKWSHTVLPPVWTIDDICISLPPREWISIIIKLTRKYPNVYTDISGLNIFNDDIRLGLEKMLKLIKIGHGYFKHLKHKLIFGSGWYLTHLIGGLSVSKKYDAYCKQFKSMVSDDKLWEHISLINPWRCYALSELGYPNKTDRLIQYVNEKSPSSEWQTLKGWESNWPMPNGWDADLAIRRLITIEQENLIVELLDDHSQKVLLGLTPETRSRAIQFISGAKDLGYATRLAEGYRTIEEQNAKGGEATNAKGVESAHTWGEAFDFDFIVGGNIVKELGDKRIKIPPNDSDQQHHYKKLGALGECLGLAHGGEGSQFGGIKIKKTNKYDNPHFQKNMCDVDGIKPYSTKVLRNEHGERQEDVIRYILSRPHF
jgi:hypothetical protein